MQAQSQLPEGQQQHPPWDMQHETVNSGGQQAAVQPGIPFGQPQAHWGDLGQVPFSQGPFDTSAAPVHNWEPQPEGVLSAPAWPSQVGCHKFCRFYLA